MDDRVLRALDEFMIGSGYYHDEIVEVDEEIPVNWDIIEKLGSKKYYKHSVDIFRRTGDSKFLEEVPKEYLVNRIEKKAVSKKVADK